MTSSIGSSMNSTGPSLSSTQASWSPGMRFSSSGAIRSLPMCQVSMARPPLGRPASVTSRIPSSSVFTFGSNGMIS